MSKKTKFSITIKPYWLNDRVEYLDISGVLSEVCIKEGETILYINEKTVNIPFCTFIKDLTIKDSKGSVPVQTISDKNPQAYIDTKLWIAERTTAGEISFDYRIKPREVPNNYRSSPYFDFRSEKGGANGAGLTFLAVPKIEHEFKFELEWDLSQMPKDSVGVWSLGKNCVHKMCQSQTVLFSYYCVGLVQSVEKDDFGIYWLSEMPYDPYSLANWTKELFFYMSEFFQDKESIYRIFVRKDPFEQSGGGTALARSFMFGYSDATENKIESVQSLLAHEMAHNWPNIPDQPVGYSTWYNEGTAEYYSVVLPYRAGLISLDDVLKNIEAKTAKYYKNPKRNMTNQELAEQYWSDRRTQVIPYGKGFVYLANVDAKIRSVTKDEKSLDDVVMALIKKTRKGLKLTVDDWLEEIKNYIGEDATKDFKNMTEGQLIVPDNRAFGGAFIVTPVKIELEDTCEEVLGFQWKINDNIVEPKI